MLVVYDMKNDICWNTFNSNEMIYFKYQMNQR